MNALTFRLGLLYLLFASSAPGQWVATNGPEGGVVFRIAASGPTVFAGTLGAGAYRSTNNGASWSSIGLSFAGDWSEIDAIAIAGSTVFIGSGAGIAVSGDGGSIWANATGNLPQSNPVVSIAVIGDSLMIGSNDGIYVGGNSGGTWSQRNAGGTSNGVYDLLVAGSKIFAATQNGVFVSTNNGRHWDGSGTGLPSLASGTRFGNTGTALLITTPFGVFRSPNGGASWVPASSGLPSPFANSFAVEGTAVFVGTYDGIGVSTDDGASWAPSSSGLHSRIVIDLAVSISSVYAATESGVFVSTNSGTSWAGINTGLKVNTASDLVTLPDGNLCASTATTGCFVSTDQGQQWSPSDAGFTTWNIYTLLTSGSVAYAGTDSGAYASTDNTASWVPINTGLPGTKNVYAFAQSGADLFAATAYGVYVSANGGPNWSPASAGLGLQSVHDIAVQGARLFATTDSGVYISGDNGGSWSPTNAGLPSLYAARLAVSSNAVIVTDGIPPATYRSTDNGATWHSIGNLGKLGFSLAAKGNVVLLGTATGVALSTDGGASWTDKSTGLPVSSGIYVVSILGNTAYAGPGGFSIWKRPLSELVTSVPEDGDPRVPHAYALLQNYPNPFNPATTIGYTIGGVAALSGALSSGVEGRAYANVRLVVYDVLGREVAVLVDDRRAPGIYEVKFDGSNLASGVYFYRIRAGDFVQARKLVLLK